MGGMMSELLNGLITITIALIPIITFAWVVYSCFRDRDKPFTDANLKQVIKDINNE